MERNEEIWPPAPINGTVESATPTSKKQNHGCLATAGVALVTLFALFLGWGAGTGHKDFSESLLSSVVFAAIDAVLWLLAVLWWVEVARAYWKTLREKPTALKLFGFWLFFGVLTVLYATGIFVSLTGLTTRATASDTVY